MGLKPFGIVKEFVEAAGMGVSYVYEDLIFIDHNAFLLQFTDDDKIILVHINRDAVKVEIEDDIARLREEAVAREIELTDGEYYTISNEDDGNIRLEFLEPE